MSDWTPLVVLEISVRGDGLHWLTGQGDISARPEDFRWFALDANASVEHNLELLRQVKEIPLEPFVEQQIDDYIRGYEELLEDENEENDDEFKFCKELADGGDGLSDDEFLKELQDMTEDDENDEDDEGEEGEHEEDDNAYPAD